MSLPPGTGWVSASSPDGTCVELRLLPSGYTAIRNSRAPEGPALVFSPQEIATFIGGVKAGIFDGFLNGTESAASPALPTCGHESCGLPQNHTVPASAEQEHTA